MYMRMRALLRPNRILASSLAFGFVFMTLLSVGTVRADTMTKPYFKVFGSDVFIGGGFNQGNTGSNCTTNYQYGGGGDPNSGGIFSFARDSGGKGAGGSSSQYGAFATGQIQGDSSGNGFYSGGAQGGAVSHSYSTFANTSASNWGGSFDGSISQSDCIPDYYARLSTYKTVGNWDATDGTPANGVFKATASGGPYTLVTKNTTINSGRSVTVYVDGNVYIDHNITYNLDNVDNVPKFAVVAKGSIYIDPGVTQLDGVFIAQPATADMSADDGDIWTCHGASSNQVLYSYPAFISACANKLVINGALIAKQVNLTRINGNLAGSNNNEDSLNNAKSSGNIAEVINFTPEMVIGGPFFNPPTVTNFKVQSLIGLPPIF